MFKDSAKGKPKARTKLEIFNNPQITSKDIEICRIRKEPDPRIVNSIYRYPVEGDRWHCRNCETRGDKCFLMIHTCRGLLKQQRKEKEENPNFSLREIQQEESLDGVFTEDTNELEDYQL